MYKKVNAQAAPLKALQIYCCFSSGPFFKLQLIEIGSALVLFLEWVYFSCLGRSRTVRSRRTLSMREDGACIQRLLPHLTISFHIDLPHRVIYPYNYSIIIPVLI